MPHRVDSHVGQKLRQRRWLVGMTQEQLGTAVGIRFQQIQKYESGANRVSASRLWDIARVLDVPISFFFDGLNNNDKPQADHLQMNGVNGHDCANGHHDQDLPSDVLVRRETADLVRAYYTIPESKRRQLLELAKAMGDAG